MAIEIERRFLVDSSTIPFSEYPHTRIIQGYLPNGNSKVVTRIRVVDNDEAQLCVKGEKVLGSGVEFEYPIPLEDAYGLLELCEATVMKDRYYISGDSDLTWEVDVFLDSHENLVIAEVELEDIDVDLGKIPFPVIREITDQHEFSNFQLAHKTGA